MKILFTALIVFLSMRAGAQEVIKIDGPDTGNIVTNTEIAPMLPGGSAAWTVYLRRHSNYSFEATHDSTAGTVIVQFIVDKGGHTSEWKVISGPTSDGYRKEALRLVRSSGLWMPGIANGRQVSAYRRVAIHFQMD